MIKFSLPGYWLKYNLNTLLLNLYQTEREKFYDDIIIDSFYDSFPCVWNGGRYLDGKTNYENIVNTINFYNSQNFSLRHTFTNSLLQNEDLNDVLCNQICFLSENSLNGINCNSIILNEYIKKHYPKFYHIHSTTKGITDISKINELSNNDIVVLDYRFNNCFEKLQQLHNPYNIEILLAEACIDNCPQRDMHYSTYSANQKYLASDYFPCEYGCDTDYFYYEYIPKRQHYISIQDIREYYLPLGLYQFKISGRTDNDINLLERYVHYLVKPEYQDEIRNRILLQLYPD